MGRGERARKSIRTVVMLTLTALCTLSFLVIPPSHRIRTYQDDALFYGIIAWNTADGHPFTFDGGTSRTTGFHWGGLVLPLVAAFVTHGLPGIVTYRDFFQILFMVDAAVLALVALLIVLAVARALRSLPAMTLLLLVVSQSLVRGFGMEQVFLPLILLQFILLEPEKPHAWLGYLAIACLALITRVDVAILVRTCCLLGFTAAVAIQ